VDGICINDSQALFSGTQGTCRLCGAVPQGFASPLDAYPV